MLLMNSQTYDMASSALIRRPSRSLLPLAIYWSVGAIAALVFLRSEIAIAPTIGFAHGLSIAVGLLVTLGTMIAYHRVALREGRSLHLPTLIGFPLLNGFCETALFLLSFKIGAALISPIAGQGAGQFAAGIVTFFAYSWAIHALFWLKLLPPHLNKSPAVKTSRILWSVGLTAVSLLWAWLYFAYQDFWSVAILHALFDAGMVYSIRYRLV